MRLSHKILKPKKGLPFMRLFRKGLGCKHPCVDTFIFEGFGGVPRIRIVVFGVCIGAALHWKLPYAYSCAGKVHLQILFVLGIGWKHARVHAGHCSLKAQSEESEARHLT